MAQLPDLIKQLRSAYASAESGKHALLDQIGNQAAQTVRNATPVDSGRLKQSIRHEVRDSQTVVVSTDVEYAPYVDQGHMTKSGSFVPGRHMFAKALLKADTIVEDGVKTFLARLNILG